MIYSGKQNQKNILSRLILDNQQQHTIKYSGVDKEYELDHDLTLDLLKLVK